MTLILSFKDIGGGVTRYTARADLNEAIQLAASIPPAKYGSVEVRPVRELQLGAE
jgi:hypothetical protein